MTPRGKKPQTIRRAITKGILNGITVTAALVAGYQLAAAAQPDQIRYTDPAPAVIVDAPTAADLLAGNDCWTAEGPQGVIPGHVVVTLDGQPTLGGSKMTGKALAQLFDGADYGLTIHGFCR